MPETKQYNPEQERLKNYAEKRERFAIYLTRFNEVMRKHGDRIKLLYDESDLLLGGERIESRSLDAVEINGEIERLQTWIRDYPEFVIEKIDGLERRKFKEAAFELACVAIGIKDPERGERVFVSFHPQKDEPEAEAMIKSDLLTKFHVPVAKGMLAGDIDEAIAYAREKDVIRDGASFFRKEDVWLRDNAISILDSDPLHALKIFERGYFGSNTHNEDKKWPKKDNDHSQFLSLVAKKLLLTDPDQALEIMLRGYDDPNDRDIRLISFLKQVTEKKIDLAIDGGDIFEAHRLIEAEDTKKSFSNRRYNTLRNRLYDRADLVAQIAVTKNDFIKARAAFDLIPTSSGRFYTACSDIFYDVKFDTAKVARKEEHLEQEWNAAVAEVLKDFPDIIASKMLDGRASRSASGNTGYARVDKARKSWSSESRLKIFLDLTELEHHSELAAEFLPEDFPSEAELGPARSVELKEKLFDAYKAGPRELLFIHAKYFQNQFAQLSASEFEKCFEGAEKFSSGNILGALAYIPRLDERRGNDLIDSMIGKGEFILFYEYSSAFAHLPISQEEALLKAVTKKPFKFALFHAHYKTKSALSKVDTKGVGEPLPKSVRHALIGSLVQDGPLQLITMSQNDKLDFSDYNFDEADVQIGYANIIETHADSLCNFHFMDLEELTSIAPDRAKIAELYIETKPRFGQMRQAQERVSWLGEYLPWGDSLKSLAKVQATAANVEHDPWKTDLEPLVVAMTERRVQVISLESAEDGAIVLDYVKEFGMINAPELFQVFVDLRRSKKKEDLGEVVQNQLRAFIGEKRYDKLDAPADLMNELRIKKRNLVTELLGDKGIPDGLETPLGREIFTSVTGATNWGRDERMEDVLAIWKQTLADVEMAKGAYVSGTEPIDITKVPEGYSERILELPKRKRSEKGKQELSSARKKILGAKALEIEMKRFIRTPLEYINGYDGGRRKFGDMAEDRFIEIEAVLLKKIESAQERASRLGDKAPKGLLDNLEKQKLQLESFQKYKEGAQDVFEGSEDQDNVYRLMESFAELGFKFEAADQYLKLLSVHHLIGFEQSVYTQVLDDVDMHFSMDALDADWSKKEGVFVPELVETYNDFLVNFLAEHYLNPNQEHHNVDHPAFSKALLWSLNRLWGLPQGKETEQMVKHPFAKAVRQLQDLERGETSTKDLMEVAMVPSQGVLRIFSGDTGDACFTSKHNALAKGEYPDLHAYTFVTGRDTPYERFAGSVLFVEATEVEGKESVLIVRASNPRENLIQAVDEEELIRGILEEAISVAKRRDIENVVVPLDPASASCSNRPAVARFYAKHFLNNKKVSLKKTPETEFNGYDNWNSSGNYPSVEIWTKEKGRVGEW